MLGKYRYVAFWKPSISAGFPCSSGGKGSPCSAGDLGSIPGSGRSPGERNGNTLQCSCLENPRDGGTWWEAIYGVAHKLGLPGGSVVKNLLAMQEMEVQSLGQEDPLEKEMTTHFSILD